MQLPLPRTSGRTKIPRRRRKARYGICQFLPLCVYELAVLTTSASPATARANLVLPVPGGPVSKTPFGNFPPRFENLSGFRKNSTTSCNYSKVCQHISWESTTKSSHLLQRRRAMLAFCWIIMVQSMTHVFRLIATQDILEFHDSALFWIKFGRLIASLQQARILQDQRSEREET